MNEWMYKTISYEVYNMNWKECSKSIDCDKMHVKSFMEMYGIDILIEYNIHNILNTCIAWIGKWVGAMFFLLLFLNII